jgi:hypothetical protein
MVKSGTVHKLLKKGGMKRVPIKQVKTKEELEKEQKAIEEINKKLEEEKKRKEQELRDKELRDKREIEELTKLFKKGKLLDNDDEEISGGSDDNFSRINELIRKRLGLSKLEGCRMVASKVRLASRNAATVSSADRDSKAAQIKSWRASAHMQLRARSITRRAFIKA